MVVLKKRTPSEKFSNLLSNSIENTGVSRGLRGIRDVEIFNINIEKIFPYEKQVRKIFSENEIKSLAESIKDVGMINPIQVIKGEKQGFFNVVNGERRLRAAKLSGLETIPCIIINDNSKTELISVIDNIQREDLHPIELAEAISSLIKNYGDKKEIADKLGLPYTSVLENLKLLELPLDIRKELLSSDISSRSILRKIVKQKNTSSMKEIIQENKKNKSKTKSKKIFDCYLSENDLKFHVDVKNITKDQIKNIIFYLESLELAVASSIKK